MKNIRKNQTIAVMTSLLRTLSLLVATGTLFQTFLFTVGFGETEIYFHATAVQAVNVTSILLFSRFADRGSPIRRCALVQIPNGLLFLFFLPFCFSQTANAFSFFLLVCVSLLQSVCTALNTVCEYKLPYLLYPAESYSAVLSVAGVVGAVATFGVGELLHYLEKTVSYTRLMLFAFLTAAVLTVLAGILTLFYTVTVKKNLRDAPKKTPAEKERSPFPLTELLRRPVFYLLIPANLLRGFATGTVTVFAAIAISLGFGAELTTRMVSLSAIANLIGCISFGFLSRFLSPRISIFMGSLCYLLLPLCLFGSPFVFLLVYAIVFFGKSVVDIAVPSLLVTAVDVEIAGPYNAYRMILHNGGLMLATAIAPFLSPAALLWISLGSAILSGGVYFFLPLLRAASPTRIQRKKNGAHENE